MFSWILFSWAMVGFLATNAFLAFFIEKPSKWVVILAWVTALIIQLTLMKSIGVL